MQTYCQTTAIQATNSREQQRTQSRELILDAAVGCFARWGFEAVSTANIANVAGAKKSLLQYHFSTKDTLWQSAIAHLWRQRDDIQRGSEFIERAQRAGLLPKVCPLQLLHPAQR
jgi:AcrR family transcriptional regulator